MALPDQLDAIVTGAITRRVFPGAVVLIAQAGATLHHAAYGTLVYDSGAVPVAHDTIYDIASLTKMFTATAALRLIDAGQLDLHMPAARYLPELRAHTVTIWHLLTHTSGLEIRLSALRHAGSAQLWARVFALVPARPPGTSVAYTNVNSLLLGEIVARLVGTPLDRALAQLVIEPLGLASTQFCPPEHLHARIAPTERDEEWRGGLVHGSVHDESAHMLGGVAGHAGLFSSAADLAQFGRMWLSAITGAAPGAPLLSPRLARLAASNQTPALSLGCGLGWMIDRPNFMGAAPAGTLGHTGFTGPAIIVSPARQRLVVVLSNRVYPRRSEPAHHQITAAIVAAALAAQASEQ